MTIEISIAIEIAIEIPIENGAIGERIDNDPDFDFDRNQSLRVLRGFA